MSQLQQYGLTQTIMQQANHYPELKIGRIIAQYNQIYRVVTEQGELLAQVSGKFSFQAKQGADYPAVGDFVMLDRLSDTQGNGVIHAVLPQKSVFSRKAVGSDHEVQIVATNIDLIFICMALNNDYNERRLERYLSIAWQSGATPVVVLTKSDLCHDVEAKLLSLSYVAIGVDVLITSNKQTESYQVVQDYIKPEQTVAFIGSSGVGKSTLVNGLIGKERLETNGLRNDDKGRHTTTRRELILLQQGGMVIDTPGMREIGLESAEFSRSFADIDQLSSRCRFSDCTHQSEPGCAVQAAIAQGVISQQRLDSYFKLKKEARYEGMNSKQIETDKLNSMFASVGGMKNAKKFTKEKNKHNR